MYILLEVGVNVLVVFLRLIVVDERDALGCACHLVSAVGGAVYGNVEGSLFLTVGDGDGSVGDVAVVVVGVHSCHGLAALHVGSHYDKVEGLVHISEIAPERIEAPSDVLEVGQVVKAEIIKMDLDSKKIGLSISKVKRDAEKNEFRSYMGSKKSHLSQNLSEQLESLEK